MNTELPQVRKFVKTVTVTGADDSISPRDLVEVARIYPFAEFGILIDGLGARERFPSEAWLHELHDVYIEEGLNLCAHLCGKPLRKFCLGDPSFLSDFDAIRVDIFQRFQLNFHARPHKVDQQKFVELIKGMSGPKSIIFQMDGVNEDIFSSYFASAAEIYFSPLFDNSGGSGRLPEEWPEQLPGIYSGYAGGLSPENITEQMHKISKVAPGPIWTDIETHVRSKNNGFFDLDKVCRFLELSEPWVIDPV